MTTPTPFLILHKVRGEPAFDIAHQIEMEGEECWIVGTSGHRAYPARQWNLFEAMEFVEGLADPRDVVGTNLWADLPDHYPAKSSPVEAKVSAKSLLTSLGLPTQSHVAVQGTLKRRI